MIRTWMLAAVLGLAGVGAVQTRVHAQMGAVGSPAGQGDPVKALDAALTGFERECMGAAEAMPAGKYGFTPASLNIPGAKYGDVKTFVQEVTHIAYANFLYFAMVMGVKPDVDSKTINAIATRDEALKVLADSFAYGHKAIATLTVANAWDPVKGMGAGATKASTAAGAVAHGFDHYGQMVEYLRMNGIVPPASAK